MEQLKIIKTLSELEGLKAYLADKDFVAFDTETDGVEKESHIIGFSVCADINLAYYVVLAHWDVASEQLIFLETQQGAKSAIECLIGKNLIMQNAPFDCSMVENNYKVKLMPWVHTDTMILGHLLNENRQNGLKERGVELFGEDAAAEQRAMKESVYANGGVLTKEKYELYKADADLIAYYGAKDAILTLKLFYHDVEKLYEEGLDQFFYEEESMPLLRGPTYDMNTTGLRVDPEKLQVLKASLTAECVEARAYIEKEVYPHVKEKYPGTGKTNHFNINASQQLAWLLYFVLDNEFTVLTKGGREMCKKIGVKPPYAPGAKREFIRMCIERKGEVYEAGHKAGKDHVCTKDCINKKTGKKKRVKKIEDPWKYIAAGKASLGKLAPKYKWVERLLEYKKAEKLLGTYVEGIQSRMVYNIIRPSFLQHGTTSGRYSSKKPNFQNLPRDDKRVKGCIVARPGKVFVGADYSQLEPRVFASVSGDERLMASFKNGDDFYSVIGAEVFNKLGCSLKKDDKNSFAKLFPMERHYSKQFGLASTYGATAFRLSAITGLSTEEMSDALNSYFTRFHSVRQFMLTAHQEAMTTGRVLSLFGRPRRMPLAMVIPKLFGPVSHEELPYEYRNILNLAVNHKIQSTGASIVNRAAIAFWKSCRELEAVDPSWTEVKIVLQVHDELVAECPQSLAQDVKDLLKHCMESAADLPGVSLEAEPNIASNLAELK